MSYLHKVTIKRPWQVSPVYVVAATWDEAADAAIEADYRGAPGGADNGGVLTIERLDVAERILVTSGDNNE